MEAEIKLLQKEAYAEKRKNEEYLKKITILERRITLLTEKNLFTLSD